MKKISVVTNCYNEAGNLQELYDRLLAALRALPGYDYEIIVADNCSTDGTRDLLRRLAARDPRFKVILNANNFGQIRSSFNALLAATGDCVVAMASDLQNPPEMIADFVRLWEAGNDVVIAVKSNSRENIAMRFVRKFYYRLLAQMSDAQKVIRDFTGFGLYDQKFIAALKKYNDPYPYFRGLVTEIGFKRATIDFVQGRRKAGRSKNNLFTLYDIAMTGFVNHSKLPLRLAAFTGFVMAGVNMAVAVSYLVYKLMYWETFSLGLAPLVIGVFFFSAVQLIFIGIIGEYIGAIWTKVQQRPLVIEEERLNFGDEAGLSSS